MLTHGLFTESLDANHGAARWSCGCRRTWTMIIPITWRYDQSLYITALRGEVRRSMLSTGMASAKFTTCFLLSSKEQRNRSIGRSSASIQSAAPLLYTDAYGLWILPSQQRPELTTSLMLDSHPAADGDDLN